MSAGQLCSPCTGSRSISSFFHAGAFQVLLVAKLETRLLRVPLLLHGLLFVTATLRALRILCAGGLLFDYIELIFQLLKQVHYFVLFLWMLARILGIVFVNLPHFQKCGL